MHVRVLGDSIARWSLVALAALLPLFVIPTPWASVVQGKLLLAALFISVALVAYIVARIAQGHFLVPRDTLLYAAMLLPLCYLVSALLSGGSASSYVSGLGTQDTVASMAILFATLALAATLFAGGSRNVVLVFLAFLGGCSLVVLFQIARLFFPSLLSLGGAISGVASSILGSWHDLGTISALLVFFAIALSDASFLGRAVRKWFLLPLGIFSFFLAVIAAASDIWYGLSALLILFALYSWHVGRTSLDQAKSGILRRTFVALAVGLAALLLAIFGSVVYTYLPAPLQVSQIEVRPSWQGTFTVAQKVFTGNGSLFGSGPNTFDSAWAKFKPVGVNETRFWSTDFNAGVGFVPTSFVTAGSLGILAWILLILALFLHTIGFIKNAAGTDRSFQAALVGACLFLLTFHIIYTPTLAVSFVLFFLLGLSIALETTDQKSVFALPIGVRSLRGGAGVLLLLLVGAAILFASAGVMRAVISDLLIQKAAVDFNTKEDVAQAISLVQKGLLINPKNDRAHRAAVELGLLQLQDLIAKGKTSDAAGLQEALSKTIQNGLTAVSIDSGDYLNWLALATLYRNLASVGIEGAYHNAISAYEKAAAANPTNPLPLIGAGQAALGEGEASTSLNYLNAAILLKPNMAVAYFLRSQAEGQMNNFPSAIKDAQTAVSLAQQDPLGWYNLGTLLYASGDYENAAAALSQAISLNNNYSNAIFVLALSYNKLNDHERAILNMRRVVELNPNNEVASSTLANLLAASSTSATTPKKTPSR